VSICRAAAVAKGDRGRGLGRRDAAGTVPPAPVAADSTVRVLRLLSADMCQHCSASVIAREHVLSVIVCMCFAIAVIEGVRVLRRARS